MILSSYQELAARLTGERGKIQMYIMTSEATKEPTLDFLRENEYFGLEPDQLTIFEQRVIPALDNQVSTGDQLKTSEAAVQLLFRESSSWRPSPS